MTDEKNNAVDPGETEAFMLKLLCTLPWNKIKREWGHDLGDSEMETLPVKLQGIASYVTSRSVQRQEGLLAELKQLQVIQIDSVRKSVQTAEQNLEASKALAISSERSAKVSRTFATCSLVAAAVAIVLSAVTSFVMIRSSTTWQEDQIPLLKKIDCKMNKVVNNTNSAPPQFSAEHVALLRKIVANTTPTTQPTTQPKKK